MNEIGAVIPAKGRDVGVQLGIDSGVLDGIQSQNAGKPESDKKAFEQVFTKWSKQRSSKTPYSSETKGFLIKDWIFISLTIWST